MNSTNNFFYKYILSCLYLFFCSLNAAVLFTVLSYWFLKEWTKLRSCLMLNLCMFFLQISIVLSGKFEVLELYCYKLFSHSCKISGEASIYSKCCRTSQIKSVWWCCCGFGAYGGVNLGKVAMANWCCYSFSFPAALLWNDWWCWEFWNICFFSA